MVYLKNLLLILIFFLHSCNSNKPIDQKVSDFIKIPKAPITRDPEKFELDLVEAGEDSTHVPKDFKEINSSQITLIKKARPSPTQSEKEEKIFFSKNDVYHTGIPQINIKHINIYNHRDSKVRTGTLKYKKCLVEHRGDCGILSMIPLLLSVDKKWLDIMFENIKKSLYIKKIIPRSKELKRNKYYRKLKYSKDYLKLLSRAHKTIDILKKDKPRPLKKSEKIILTEFIKETMLLHLFSNSDLNNDFYEGRGKYRDYRISEKNRSTKISSAGSPKSWGRQWWISEQEFWDFWSYVSGAMPQKNYIKLFHQRFYYGSDIYIPMKDFSKFTPPKILIILQGNYFNYLILEKYEVKKA